MPETVTHFGAEALVDGAFHAAFRRSEEGLSPLLQQFHLQTVFPLADDCSGGRPRFDSGTPVGRQAVFLAAVKNGADAPGETPHGQRNRCDSKHQTAPLRPTPDALSPEVRAGKGTAPVRFDISHPVGEIDLFAVQFQRSLERMPHTDDSVGTLHSRKKSEQPHNVRLENSKRAVAQGTVEGKPILLNMEGDPLAVEAGWPDLDLKRLPGELKLRLRVLQPPCCIARNDLERGGTAASAVEMKRGNQREGLSLRELVL